MKVKSLNVSEISRTRRLGKMFADEVKLFGGYVPAEFEKVWVPCMETNLAKIFYVEDDAGEMVGFLGASFVPDLYAGLPAAQSQFWYVAPEYRKGSASVRLFNAFEDEAAARGTRKYFVGHKAGIHEDSMREFFIRRGYVLGEFMYWRNI